MLLREIRKIFHGELDEIYPEEEVDNFFYLAIDHYLGLERFVLALQPNLIVSKSEEQPLFEALGQLRLQKPIQYILGSTQFMDLKFKVNENVLIPRPETEELVRWVIDEFRILNSKFRILDIGTGSGCIAIALAKNLPKAEVYAIDISGTALKVAHGNSEMNGTQVKFLQKDILNLDFDLELDFDVIVSNPPYVRHLEKKEMKSNVVDHEPPSALFVDDNDSLIFYKKIVEFARDNLKENGTLFFEINQYLGKETKNLLEADFYEIELRKDMFGNDRMLKGKINV